MQNWTSCIYICFVIFVANDCVQTLSSVSLSSVHPTEPRRVLDVLQPVSRYRCFSEVRVSTVENQLSTGANCIHVFVCLPQQHRNLYTKYLSQQVLFFIIVPLVRIGGLERLKRHRLAFKLVRVLWSPVRTHTWRSRQSFEAACSDMCIRRR